MLSCWSQNFHAMRSTDLAWHNFASDPEHAAYFCPWEVHLIYCIVLVHSILFPFHFNFPLRFLQSSPILNPPRSLLNQGCSWSPAAEGARTRRMPKWLMPVPSHAYQWWYVPCQKMPKIRVRPLVWVCQNSWTPKFSIHMFDPQIRW